MAFLVSVAIEVVLVVMVLERDPVPVNNFREGLIRYDPTRFINALFICRRTRNARQNKAAMSYTTPAAAALATTYIHVRIILCVNRKKSKKKQTDIR